MNRKLRSRIDAIFPDPSSKVVEKQQQMKEISDAHSRIREFTPGQLVYVSTLGKLVPGVVVEKHWLRYVQSDTPGWSHRYPPS